MYSNDVFTVFQTYIKMSKDFSAKYYQNNEERLQRKAPKRYQGLPKQEKEKKHQYVRERYKNLPENEKQKLVACRKKILQNEKKCLIIFRRNFCFKKNDLESPFDAKYRDVLKNPF